MGAIYVLRSEKNTYKIGFSKNPKQRFMDIRVGNHGVQMVGIYQGEYKDERYLHRAFAEKRIRGEWFTLDITDLFGIDEYFKGKEDVKYFKQLLIDGINDAHPKREKRSLSGDSKINFHQIPLPELDKCEVLEAAKSNFSLKTLRYFKRIWLSMPDATNREICAKSRYAIRTTSHAMSVLRMANKFQNNE